MAIRNLTVRIDSEVLDKLHIISNYEGRSSNSQILLLLRDIIEKYETEHSEILFNKTKT